MGLPGLPPRLGLLLLGLRDKVGLADAPGIGGEGASRGAGAVVLVVDQGKEREEEPEGRFTRKVFTHRRWCNRRSSGADDSCAGSSTSGEGGVRALEWRAREASQGKEREEEPEGQVHP